MTSKGRPLSPSEVHSEVMIKKKKAFDDFIERRHGTSINPPKPMKVKSDTKEPDNADGDADTQPAVERLSIGNRCGIK
jgi:hypothetical protein